MCSLAIDGVAHGPEGLTTTCKLYMRHFNDGDVTDVEPWHAESFRVVRDAIVDCSALDRITRPEGVSPALSTRFRTISTFLNIQPDRSMHFLVLCWIVLFIVIHVALVLSTGPCATSTTCTPPRTAGHGLDSPSAPPP